MRALEEMIAALGAHPTLIAMQRTMARAFGDPTLRLLFWRPTAQAYSGVDGEVVGLETFRRAALTEFTRSDEKVAAVMHDAVLVVNRDLLETAGRALDCPDERRPGTRAFDLGRAVGGLTPAVGAGG